MRRIFAKIAAVICVCMVVGGCSVRDGMAGAFGMRIVSPESAELDDVIAAIALNPSSKKFETVDKGYVALVHSNGRAEYIQTEGMLQQHIVWNDTGVFFQDQKRDYLISNEHGKGYVKDRQETFGTQWALVSVANDAGLTVGDQLTVFLESGAIETVNTTTSHIDHQHFHLPDSLGNDSYPLSRTLLTKGTGGFATVIAVPEDGRNRCKILVYKLYESDIQNLDSVYAIDTDGRLNEMLSGTTDYLSTDFAPNPRMHWKAPDAN